MTICDYLLPLRRNRFCGAEARALANYFAFLTNEGCDVLVIDGSPPDVFFKHSGVFAESCRHIAVNPRFGYLNDKVNGIHTGVELAHSGKVIVADDDIRYSGENLSEVCALLDEYEVVRPQNFLRPLPWWASMEASRMLINRALLPVADYPGTCAFRRQTFVEAGHYDGNVLFDNEEMLRHFAVSGANIAYAEDLFIEKRSPAVRKWLEQRPRQAYEDFPLRAKTAFFFSLIPLLVLVGLAAGISAALAAFCFSVIASLLIALKGRSRGNAAKLFPLRCCFFAPLWICERAISTYWALGWKLIYGGYPFGDQLLSRGVGRAWRKGGEIASTSGRRVSGTV